MNRETPDSTDAVPSKNTAPSKDTARPSFRQTMLPAIALIGLFSLVLTLEGFVLTGASWSTNSATYRINPNFPGVAPGTPDQQIEAIRCGADAWRQQGQSNINLTYLGTTGITTVNSNDGVNAAYYTPTNPGGGTLAVTFYTFSGPNLIAFDMAFYQSNNFGPIIWNGVGDPGSTQTDLISVATHEFGHAIGIDHTPVSNATMFASYADGTSFVRTLVPDDVAATQALYGFNGSINDAPQINDVDPPEGPTSGGNTVTITGENFTWEADTILRIDNVVLNPSQWNLDSGKKLVINNMPANSPGPVSIRIDNELGTFTLNNAYNYGGQPPTISSVNPASGPLAGGNQVSIIGTNLASDAVVAFGVQLATNVFQVSSSELLVTVPGSASTGTVNVSVSQASGSDVLNDAYLYSTNIVRLDGGSASIGSSGFTSQALATNDVEISGFSLAVAYDGTFLNLVDLTLAGTAAEQAEFFQQGENDSGGPTNSYWTCGVVMSFDNTVTIPPGNETPIVAATYAVESFAPDGGLSVLDLQDGAGSPPTDNVFSPPSGVAIAPLLIDGLITFVVGGFIRGDANQDATVDVADAVSILGFLFSQGPGPCADALDANDDGAVDIADAIYVLGYLFSQGPQPPPPFPGEGADPTPDPLGC